MSVGSAPPCIIQKNLCNKSVCTHIIQKDTCFTGGADKSLARPTSRCILFDSENISFDASLVIYINSTNIPPPIMIINRIYENREAKAHYQAVKIQPKGL